jgi:hypothetical protein
MQNNAPCAYPTTNGCLEFTVNLSCRPWHAVFVTEGNSHKRRLGSQTIDRLALAHNSAGRCARCKMAALHGIGDATSSFGVAHKDACQSLTRVFGGKQARNDEGRIGARRREHCLGEIVHIEVAQK